MVDVETITIAATDAERADLMNLETRSPIALSWSRSEHSGLDPGSAVRERRIVDIDCDTPLLRAARPVLDELARHLAGTRFGLLLADSDACIVARHFGDAAVAAALDNVLACPGVQYREDIAGTNALSTALEIGSALSVTGDEHYLDSLKNFSCYAQPITHPVNGVLAGVLDITGLARDAGGLMPPLVARAVRDIEDQLCAGSRITHQRMLAALHTRARYRRPVLVVGNDLTLTNTAADSVIDDTTRHHLRQLCTELDIDHEAILSLDRPDGPPWRVSFRRVPGTDAVMCELDIGATKPKVPRGTNARHDLATTAARHRSTRTSVLVHGEPGTGHADAAGTLAGPAGVVTVDPSSPDLARLLSEADGPLLVIEGISGLDDHNAERLATQLDTATTWFALISGPVDQLSSAQQALAARCAGRMRLLPLRERRRELGQLATDALRRLDAKVRLTPGAIAVLERHTWPGNMPEFDAVLTDAARRCLGDVIQPHDLPQQLRAHSSRRLGPLEQTERDTIIACLERHQGNKVHAARELDIGRNTLYRRMRALGIDT